MSDWLSNKFRWLSLIATWAVVCIHSRTDRWVVGVEDYATRIESHVADLFHFAVSLFFLISGYMFVHSYEKHGWGGLLKRKFKSLYVPMVIWGLVGIVLCLPIRLYAHNDIPTVVDVCKLPLMIFRSEAVHFWYVRALIVWFALAPIAAYVAKRTLATLLLIIAALLIPAGSWAALAHVPVSVFFFLLGMRFSNIKCARFPQWGVVICTIACMTGLALSFLFKEQVTEHYFSVLFEPLFMIGVLWFAYDIVDAKFHIGKFPESLNVLFFVYCMHLIILCWCGGVMRVLLGASPAARLCGYFALWLTFWLNVWLSFLIKRWLPSMYLLMSGGR